MMQRWATGCTPSNIEYRTGLLQPQTYLIIIHVGFEKMRPFISIDQNLGEKNEADSEQAYCKCTTLTETTSLLVFVVSTKSVAGALRIQA